VDERGEYKHLFRIVLLILLIYLRLQPSLVMTKIYILICLEPSLTIKPPRALYTIVQQDFKQNFYNFRRLLQVFSRWQTSVEGFVCGKYRYQVWILTKHQESDIKGNFLALRACLQVSLRIASVSVEILTSDSASILKINLTVAGSICCPLDIVYDIAIWQEGLMKF
jgi:hypothetical protein